RSRPRKRSSDGSHRRMCARLFAKRWSSISISSDRTRSRGRSRAYFCERNGMSELRLAIKIDVDTDRGTREGVPALKAALARRGIPACFLFSLGPDNTGRAIRRIFRPGFFSKVSRTSVVSVYGIRTLMNGVLLPGPDIARRNAAVMRSVADAGFETGIHCWDHVFWQD